MIDQSLLALYGQRLKKLKQGGTRYGKAPHKPVLLLTLFELIEKGFLTENCVKITPELVATFKENFALLVRTGHKDDFTQPLFYLQNDGFWFLKTKAGPRLDTYIRSFQTLNDRLAYGYFSDDLFLLLNDESARLYLKEGST